jgi:hypothetical protein
MANPNASVNFMSNLALTLLPAVDFCRSERGLGIIETALVYGRPPIEPLVPYLTKILGPDQMKINRVKQALGVMVRDIVADMGWEVDKVVRLKVEFSEHIGHASTYKRKSC